MSDAIDFKDLNRRMDGAIQSFKSDLASLRTGRASANLLDAIQVGGLRTAACQTEQLRLHGWLARGDPPDDSRGFGTRRGHRPRGR